MAINGERERRKGGIGRKHSRGAVEERVCERVGFIIFSNYNFFLNTHLRPSL